MIHSILPGIIGQLQVVSGTTCSSVQTIDEQIGNGTSNASYAPAYGLYDYSWYAAIYRASEFTSGATTERQIEGIEIEVGGYTTPYTYINQNLILYHVQEDTFDSSPAVNLSDLTISDETYVKSGFTFTISSNGYQTITFDENFCYNGTDNLLLVWENRDGSWASGFGHGEYDFSPSISRAAHKEQDTTYPTGDGTRTNGRINTIFKY